MFPALNTRSGALLASVRIMQAASGKDIKLKVIDYSDGILPRILRERGIDFEYIDLARGDWLDCIGGNDVVFGFNNDLYLYPYILKRVNPYIYIYDVFPPFWSRFMRPKGMRIPFEQMFLRKILSSDFFKNGISVMESASKRALAKRFTNFEFEKLHISPVSIEIKGLSYFCSPKDSLRLTYIGRSEVWKMTPLARIIRDIKLSVNFPPVELRVVVSDVRRAKEILTQLVPQGIDITIYFYENLNQDELDDIILRNTDVGFAMGTSVLEFSKYGVPSVLVDFSCHDFPDSYGYKWFFEAEPCCLGLDLDDPDNASRLIEGHSMNDLIDSFLLSPIVISKNCHEHAKKYHSIDENVDEILERVLKTPIRAGDISALPSYLFNIAQYIRKKILGMRRYER